MNRTGTPNGHAARRHRAARFLGRSIGWTTVVLEFAPPARLVLDISDGPFVGTVTYEIEPCATGSVVRIRNVGAPGKFAWMPSFLVHRAMKASITKDLARLESAITS